jgi:hypothetical protein
MATSFDLACIDGGSEAVTVDSRGDGVYVLSQWEREGLEVPLLHKVVVSSVADPVFAERLAALRALPAA